MICSYHERQRFREADDEGFGVAPHDVMSLDQAEDLDEEREQEDLDEPPCGECEACQFNEEEDEYDDEET